MRLLLLVNNWVGWQITSWLKERDEEIVGLVLHPYQNRKYGNEITSSIGLPGKIIFDGSRLNESSILHEIAALKADIALSILFDYILQDEFIRLFSKGVINLHPAYLPYNRGQYPNVWSIVEGTPAGVTLHYIDTNIDTGDIIAQIEVPISPVDTGESLYRKLEKACVELFVNNWPHIKNGKVKRMEQSLDAGTCHRATDVQNIDEIDLYRQYMAIDLINILRARTFAPYNGAYFRDKNNRKVFLKLNLYYDD
jgi:methionyl-tRNA formyltransferase